MRNHSLVLIALAVGLGFAGVASATDEFERVEQRFQSQLDSRTDDQLSQMAHQALEEQIQALAAGSEGGEARLAGSPARSASEPANATRRVARSTTGAVAAHEFARKPASPQVDR
jgi:hypothetical protein